MIACSSVSFFLMALSCSFHGIGSVSFITLYTTPPGPRTSPCPFTNFTSSSIESAIKPSSFREENLTSLLSSSLGSSWDASFLLSLSSISLIYCRVRGLTSPLISSTDDSLLIEFGVKLLMRLRLSSSRSKDFFSTPGNRWRLSKFRLYPLPICTFPKWAVG